MGVELLVDRSDELEVSYFLTHQKGYNLADGDRGGYN